MNRKFSLFILSFWLIQAGISQTIIIKCKGDSLSLEEGNTHRTDWFMRCPGEPIEKSNIPKPVNDSLENYLFTRVGKIFASGMVLTNSKKIFCRQFAKILKGWLDNINVDTLYIYNYVFHTKENATYKVVLAFNHLGQFVTTSQLPDIKIRPDFDKLLSLCRIKEIADRDQKYKGKSQVASLEFTDTGFVWKITKSPIKKSSSDGVTPELLIDAVSGQIISRKESHWTIEESIN